MTITTLALLSSTTYGVPSGNYDGSSTDFISDPQKAVDYYQGQGSLQTVFIRVTGFEGILTLQATLDYNADEANWFEVYEFDSASSTISDHFPVNLTGNFTWMRVLVDSFNGGTINFVNLTY